MNLGTRICGWRSISSSRDSDVNGKQEVGNGRRWKLAVYIVNSHSLSSVHQEHETSFLIMPGILERYYYLAPTSKIPQTPRRENRGDIRKSSLKNDK